MDHLKKNQSNTPKYKIIECYICRNRAMENTYRNFFIFGGNKFSSTNFREHIRHYTISQNNYIFLRIA